MEVYGDNAPTDKSYREWFRHFKNGDFSVEDKPRCEKPKKFEDEESKALLDEDPTQMQEEQLGSIRVEVEKRRFYSMSTVGPMLQNR